MKENTIFIAPSSATMRWGSAQYLACASVPLLAYQFWTLGSWLASSPHQVTDFRTEGSVSWYLAWAIQAVLLIAVLLLLWQVVRECRREQRLTFDAMMLIGLVLTTFWDTLVNFVEPLWFYSTNWVNLNDWWGHAPLVLNPAAGRGPQPIVLLGLLYICGLIQSKILSKLMWAVRLKWPQVSNVRLVAITFIPASLIGAALSLTMILPYLWGGPWPFQFSPLGGQYRWSVFEFLYIGLWSTTLASLYFFVNDRGERITERGLDHLTPRLRTAVSLLATIAACNLSVIAWSAPLIFVGLYNSPYPDYPRHLSSIVCDTPGLTGSDYGPCPGSKGFRVPLPKEAAAGAAAQSAAVEVGKEEVLVPE